MTFDRTVRLLLVCALLIAGAIFIFEAGLVSAPWGEDHATVTVVGDDGEPKATVDAEVADTHGERYTGLSDHDSLEDGDGMLFVHSSEGERTYVMRNMDFDIDIIFIDANKEITAIEHARAPEAGEDGNDLEHTGVGQWVLEVPRGYANQTEMAVGDTVEIEYR